MTMRNLVLLFMAAAVVAGAFAPVAPDAFASYIKAAGLAATGLAALFMHPPSLGADPQPAPVPVPEPQANP